MDHNILTILGNGFDIGHGLPTQFSDFIASNPNELESKYKELRMGGEDWNDIESLYGKRLMEEVDSIKQFDVYEIVDKIIDDYGFDEYGEIAYYCYKSNVFKDQINNMASILNKLRLFELDFKHYLEHACNGHMFDSIVPCKHIENILQSSSKIITFNYTLTVERVYNIQDIEHIHGKIDTSIAIGTGTLEIASEALMDSTYPTIDMFPANKYGLQECMRYWSNDWDDNLDIEHHRGPIERNEVKRFFDVVVYETNKEVGTIIDLIEEKNKNNLESRKKIINSLSEEQYDEVAIINHSLGEADQDVFKAINRDAFIWCYYYTYKDKINAERFLKENGWRYELIQSDVLYKKDS